MYFNFWNVQATGLHLKDQIQKVKWWMCFNYWSLYDSHKETKDEVVLNEADKQVIKTISDSVRNCSGRSLKTKEGAAEGFCFCWAV